MRTRIPSLAGLTGALLLCTAGWAATPDDAEPAAGQRLVLDDAVRVALQCELNGNDVDRNALLQHVLEQDPEFTPARWHLGQLRVNDREWVPYRRFVDDEDERWHQLYLYRKAREERGDTVDDQLYLADGARSRGMWDEARAHLMRILELEWNNIEARQRLGHRRIEGRWVSAERMEQASRDFERWVVALEQWTPRIEELTQSLRLRSPTVRETAETELFAIRDPSAIPGVELLFARGDETRTLRYLDWLAQIDAWEASVALARQSVLSESTRVRVRARNLLQPRRVEDFAPTLLAALRVDESNIARFLMWDGRFVFAYVESREHQEATYERISLVSFVPVATVNLWTGRGGISGLTHGRPVEIAGYTNDVGYRATADRHLNDRKRSSMHQFAPAQRLQNRLNSRVVRTLQEVTGQRFAEPDQWWDWWIQHSQVYASGPKPTTSETYEEEWFVDDRGQPRRRRPQSGPVVNVRLFAGTSSCFASGTPVVTEYGPKPIEEIVLGDRVLAQDVDTGRIAFQPVFKTTTRPPVQLLKVTTEVGDLVCTAGHPFWINGLGWRYAWELEPGMRFHSIDGSSEILSVEDSGRKEKAYNLVVADYHNYFVGEGRILSHDNSPRNPTNALVPGLMPDWSAASEDTD